MRQTVGTDWERNIRSTVDRILLSCEMNLVVGLHTPYANQMFLAPCPTPVRESQYSVQDIHKQYQYAIKGILALQDQIITRSSSPFPLS
jgi:hypothetical protein